MSEAFQLVDPQSAREYLMNSGAAARNKGEALFQRNNVHDLIPERPGVMYSARVQTDREYRVELEYDEIDGWLGTCSCPLEMGCEKVCDALQIWPAFPPDEYEFWLYVAYAAREHHAELPEFMAPITDLDAIEERMTKWRRTREIEKWKQTLGNLRAQVAAARPASRG